MNKKIWLSLLAVFVLLGTQSCATMQAESAISDAEVEISKAKAMGNEWRDSKKLLEKADKALEDGDTETASKLAAKAKKQGLDAQAQAKSQMNVAGPH